MEAQLNQAGTYAAQNYADSFFRQLPTDSRFLQVAFAKFPTSSSIDTGICQFILNRFDAANVYQIQNAHLELQIVILKTKDNSVPDANKKVAPVNNILHSAFESVSLKINDQPITTSSSNYPYKAYITSTLSYPSIVKVAQLQTDGYYPDISGHMDTSINNGGFNERNQLFRKERTTTSEYKPEGARFFGKLQLDLLACPSGLVPGTKVEIEVR